ncbi:MipA/OmpV family protein [Pseudoalteromonas sp. T1lg76]|uniref:MipA/OmpV family protein n=1 Tax=Pseudoalteromonas sp. T1lg76 TaxID=2077103 RepID=UPI000CF61210|nr:MipA/OmpV family protein [Pseudoalteromonas sp. T1lg76]
MNKHIALACTLFSASVLSQDAPSESAQYIEVGTLEASVTLGYGGIENPIQGAEHVTSVLLPHLAYYGEKWYFDDFALGYSLHQDKSWYLDIVGAFNEDGFFFELDGIDKLFATSAVRNSPRPGRPNATPIELTPIERSLAYEGGLALGYSAKNWGLELSTLHDISGVHNGLENKFIAYYSQDLLGGQFVMEAGVTHKSTELIEYYYRIHPGEALSRIPRYDLNSALNYHLKFEYKYRLSEQLSAMLNISNTWIDNDLSDTPMFDRDQYMTGFTGITFEF